MAPHSRSVDEKIARVNEVFARLDALPAAAEGARRRVHRRSVRQVGKRAAGFGAAVVALIVATIVFSQVVGAIGLFGLFLVGLATLALLILFSAWPGEPERVAYDEKLPPRAVARQLETLLVRRRPALPDPAARRADAIAQRLPLLEQRLAEVDPLDPLAQDAHRLMGRHLPDLLDRYERLDPAYARRPDAEGMTADQRLVAGLDAACEALDEIGEKLEEEHRRAFETQHRFIESRYKQDRRLEGE